MTDWRRAQIDKLQRELDAVERLGPDNHPDGTVLCYDAPGSLNGAAKRLTYVAVKAGGKWWTTATWERYPWSWEKLVEHMAHAKQVWHADEWSAL